MSVCCDVSSVRIAICRVNFFMYMRRYLVCFFVCKVYVFSVSVSLTVLCICRVPMVGCLYAFLFICIYVKYNDIIFIVLGIFDYIATHSSWCIPMCISSSTGCFLSVCLRCRVRFLCENIKMFYLYMSLVCARYLVLYLLVAISLSIYLYCSFVLYLYVVVYVSVSLSVVRLYVVCIFTCICRFLCLVFICICFFSLLVVCLCIFLCRFILLCTCLVLCLFIALSVVCVLLFYFFMLYVSIYLVYILYDY